VSATTKRLPAASLSTRAPFHDLALTTYPSKPSCARDGRMIALADCAVVVSNAKEAARWWEEKVGFAVHTVGNGTHAVMVAPPGDRFVLHLCEGIDTVQPGNSGIAFVTDDIEGMVANMLAAGVRFAEPLRKETWGGVAKFEDPDGNVFWILGAPTAFIRAQTTLRAPPAANARKRAGPRKPSPRLRRARA